MTEEIWRPISGFDGVYQVSSLGRVKSLARKIWTARGHYQSVRERILKPIDDKHGFHIVILHFDGDMETKEIGELVLETFVAARPPGLVCCRFDGNRTNNAKANLFWGRSRRSKKRKPKPQRLRSFGDTFCEARA